LVALATKYLPSSERTSAGLEGVDEGGEHLVHVAHDAEVGDAEDRRLLVLVDRDDVLPVWPTW
jgi:hypothetical protein